MSVRCFVAIELPDDVRELLARAEAVVGGTDATWRDEKWVPEANLHITLKFVGHIPEDSVETLVSACASEIGPMVPFEIALGPVRAIPGPGRPRMLWGTFVDPSGRCEALAAAAERAGLVVGVEPETRPFKPHVTLVRARSPHAIAPAALDAANDEVTVSPSVVSVTAATVFRSTLSPKGPTYTALARCPLLG